MNSDHAFMARALELARKGLYSTHPNPRVGCVIVNDGRIVGEGWHARAGEPHAEVYALRQASTRARGATAFVTLEPCSHHGRTPPCADALIAAGVARVVVAMQDPNPEVAGQGLSRLMHAGIEVHSGVLEAEVRPSRLIASLARTNGMPCSMRLMKPAFNARASASSTPLCTAIPAWLRRARPRPATSGLGSCMAATTRATPAAINASAQGGVRP